jgi:hypothetical protein
METGRRRQAILGLGYDSDKILKRKIEKTVHNIKTCDNLGSNPQNHITAHLFNMWFSFNAEPM